MEDLDNWLPEERNLFESIADRAYQELIEDELLFAELREELEI